MVASRKFVASNDNDCQYEAVMAKQQTFGDKTKKKAGDTRVNVKVIKAFRSDKGTIKYMERFVKVDDIGQVDKLDITR